MNDFKWALLTLAIILAVLLLAGSLNAHAQSAIWAHGIVQDESYVGVTGGTVRIDHEHNGRWYKERETANMQSHAFGWDLTKPGNYRVAYEKLGYEVVWIRDAAFTLTTAPTGDIQVNVKRIPIPVATATPTMVVPTTLYPPTVDATRTPRPTPTPNPAVSYITLTAPVVGTVMAFQAIALDEYVPASCFEIAATQEGCPLSVTQPWVGKVSGECWKFQPFSCPWRGGIELVARCESPCEVGVIGNGYW